MPDPSRSSRRVLDPADRTAEVVFGLIMVLTFTGSLSVAEAGEDDVRAMLIGALGCNIAWGIIDGVLYLMGCLAENARNLAAFHAVRRGEHAAARRALADVLPSVVADSLEPAHFDRIAQRLRGLPEPPARARLHRDDWLGAVGVFLLVFLSTFPVAIPFLVMAEAGPALRVSNGIAVAMLFVTGWKYGRHAGHNPAIVGSAMVLLGVALVGMTILLGG